MIGTIPQLPTTLENLNVKNNLLIGQIKTQFSNMASLNYLDCSFNRITGTLPKDLSELTSLSFLNLGSNLLVGSLPSELGLLSALSTLDLSYNSFDNTIPVEIANIVGLKVLILSKNQLTGTIPTQFGQMTNLVSLILNTNKLRGNLPQQFQDLSNMEYLYLQENDLSGLLPAAIMMLPLLEGINLSDNQLTNNLNNIFNPQTSKSLQYIILSHMHLTGSLPDHLFDLPDLITLVLSGNCITGTFPVSACNSKLSNLYLDGIGLGPTCHKDNDDKTQFRGIIPACIFAQTNLETLHLAGNGLTGTISSLSSSSNLSSLNLANNRLEGELPLSIQEHLFTSVDISSNKISGTLSDSFYPPSVMLNMTKNRLSGKPPSTLQKINKTLTLNVLEGNLFGCPQLLNDLSADKVSCGSTELNIPFIAWLVILSAMLILLFSMWYTILKYVSVSVLIYAKKEISQWWEIYHRYLSLPESASDADILALYHTRNALNILERACSVSLIVLVIYIVVVMITFIGLKATTGNGMYTCQYLYTTTAAFFRGNTAEAFIWIYVLLVSTIIAIFLAASRPLGLIVAKSGLLDAHRVRGEEDVLDYQDYSKKISMQVLSEFLATVIILAVNVLYLYIVYFVQPILMTLINMVFAIIKVLMINSFIPSIIKLIRKNSRAIHYVTMIMMVNVIIPGLAVLLESPLCYYYRFTPTSIYVSYAYPQVQNSIEGEGAATTETLYKSATEIIIPQWHYSYQCSSSFLNVYLPNYSYYYLINCFILPLMNLITMLIPARFFNEVVQKGQVKKIFNILDDTKMIDNIELSNLDCIRHDGTDTSIENVYTEGEEQTNKTTSSSHRIEASDTNSKENEYLIDVSNLMPNLCVDVIMLLTFGLASPLLAVLIAVRIIINTFLWRLALGRYVHIVTKKFSLNACYQKLEHAFTDEWRCLSKSWYIITIFVGVFWSLFIFDIIGDLYPTKGLVASLMMLIFYPLLFITIQVLSAGDIQDASNENNPRFTNDRISIITNNIAINRFRSQLNSFLNTVHLSIWSNIFHAKTLHETVQVNIHDNVMRKAGRITILKETTSPLCDETIENSRITIINETISPLSIKSEESNNVLV